MRTTVLLPESLYATLKEIADDERRSTHKQIIYALERYAEEEKRRRRLSSRTMQRYFDQVKLDYGWTDEQLAEQLGITIDQLPTVGAEPIPIGVIAGFRADGADQLNPGTSLPMPYQIKEIEERHGITPGRLLAFTHPETARQR